MKTILLSAVLATLILPLSAEQGTIPNPAINYTGFARLTAELAPVREKNRVTEDQFITMAAEPGTIIFDARTKNRTPIAVVGLRDSIIVQTDDATMVAHKSQAQKIKDLVKKLAEDK